MSSQNRQENRRIIFVAHSLGGLVVQQSLALSLTSTEKHIRPVLERTVGIVFMGTPYDSSNLETWASLGVGMTQMLKSTNKELLVVLVPDSEMLAHIQRDFCSLLRNRKDSEISITCFLRNSRIQSWRRSVVEVRLELMCLAFSRSRQSIRLSLLVTIVMAFMQIIK